MEAFLFAGLPILIVLVIFGGLVYMLVKSARYKSQKLGQDIADHSAENIKETLIKEGMSEESAVAEANQKHQEWIETQTKSASQKGTVGFVFFILFTLYGLYSLTLGNNFGWFIIISGVMGIAGTYKMVFPDKKV